MGALKAYTLKTACLCAALSPLSFHPCYSLCKANAEAHPTSNAEEMTQEKIDEANNAYDSAASTKLTFIQYVRYRIWRRRKKEPIRPKHHITKEKNYRLKAVVDWAASHNFDVQAVLDNGDVVGANSPEMNAWNNSDKTDIHVSRAGGWYCAVETIALRKFPSTQPCYSPAEIMIFRLPVPNQNEYQSAKTTTKMSSTLTPKPAKAIFIPRSTDMTLFLLITGTMPTS